MKKTFYFLLCYQLNFFKLNYDDKPKHFITSCTEPCHYGRHGVQPYQRECIIVYPSLILRMFHTVYNPKKNNSNFLFSPPCLFSDIRHCRLVHKFNGPHLHSCSFNLKHNSVFTTVSSLNLEKIKIKLIYAFGIGCIYICLPEVPSNIHTSKLK